VQNTNYKVPHYVIVNICLLFQTIALRIPAETRASPCV